MTFFPAPRSVVLLSALFLTPSMGMAQDVYPGTTQPQDVYPGTAEPPVLHAPVPVPPDLTIVMKDGRVKLSARNVPISRILTEWARVGQTRVVNGQRVSGPPLTIELNWVTERDALDTILRSVSGYVAAPRPAGTPGVSTYDRIMIMPGAGAQLAMRPPMGAPAPPPVFQQPQQDGDPLAPETMSFDAPTDGQEAPTFEPPEEVPFPGGTGPGEVAQPFTPGQDANPLFPGNYPGGVPGAAPGAANPWNVPPGTPMPGVISPPPLPAEPSNPQPPVQQ